MYPCYVITFTCYNDKECIPSDFQKHRETCLPSTTCPYCQKSFTTPTILKNHIISAHTKKWRFVCSICNEGFTHESKLKTHVSTRHKEGSKKCGWCDEKFDKAKDFEEHRNVCTPTNTCPYCQAGGEYFL